MLCLGHALHIAEDKQGFRRIDWVNAGNEANIVRDILGEAA